MLKKISLALGMLACLEASLAFSADRQGAFFVRPAIGYYFPASKRHLQGTAAPGLTLGYDFTHQWGLAAGAVVINTNQDNNAGGRHVHGFLYTLDAIYRLADWHGFNPYVMAGPQVTTLDPATGLDPATQAGASIGLGLTHYFSDSIGLSVQARDLYTFSGGKNDVLLDAGLVILMGG